MLITFEGIDGAGKTTIAELIFRHLESHLPNLQYYSRKSPDFADPYTQIQMKRLANIIWPNDLEHQEQDPFGNNFWILLMASWFAAMHSNRLAPAADNGTPLIIDSWYYRMIARMTAQGLDREWLNSLFQGIRNPELVVLLDIKPELAWHRIRANRKRLKPFETGRWQMVEGDEYARFCTWQERVRTELLSMVEPNNWLVVEQTKGLTAESVARKIEDHILSTL